MRLNRIGRRTAIAMGALIALAIILSLVQGAPAQTPEDVARFYSANFFIRKVCPQFLRVDDAFGARLAADLLEYGSSTFGKEKIREAVTTEMTRRRAEVAVTGEFAWCRYQRASMTADGMTALFPVGPK